MRKVSYHQSREDLARLMVKLYILSDAGRVGPLIGVLKDKEPAWTSCELEVPDSPSFPASPLSSSRVTRSTMRSIAKKG